jgi:hypothetical protein
MKCLEWPQRIRPVRDGMILYRGSSMSQIKNAVRRPNHTVPPGRAFSLTRSRHFMPGYHHPVPPGRRPALPSRIAPFAVSPVRRVAGSPVR